jgi:CPA1 family monovalent cation:H+ antiporter
MQPDYFCLVSQYFMAQFLQSETLIIELLLVVSIVAIVVRGLRIPYTVALVIVGLLITLQSPIKFELTPELILGLFVPPLIFEAAFHLNFTELRRNLVSILIFAIPGVILTTCIVGGMLALTGSVNIQLAFLFGALISATDPLAIVATFRKLGIPNRLSVLVEGESLLNDGTAIVMFNIMLVVALSGKFNLPTSVGNFLQISIGGVVIGLILGWVISRMISQVDDYLIETTLTTVLAYGSYLLAEQFHFSGVLAVVTAGLICANLGPQGMSPTTRIIISNFWEYIAFLINSIVFLLIGLQVNFSDLGHALPNILWAILAVLIARVLIVYGLSWIINRFTTDSIPIKWQHLLSWSGLRGAISLALALSLPIALGQNRDLLRAMAYGVVLFSLIVQSTTMQLVIRWLHIISRSEAQVEYELRHARLASLRMADQRIDRLHDEGSLSTHTWELLKQHASSQAEKLVVAVRGLLQAEPALEAEELDKGWRELLRSQRSALLGLRRDGVITQEVFEKLAAEVDTQLLAGSPSFLEDGASSTQFLEVTILADSAAIGKTLADLGLPRGVVVVSIHRDKETIIPHGDTLLEYGDIMTILCKNDSISAVKKLLISPDQSA